MCYNVRCLLKMKNNYVTKNNHKLIYFQRSSSKNDFLPSLNKTVDLLSFIFLHGIGPYYKNFYFKRVST